MIVFLAVCDSLSGEALAVATSLDKLLFERGDLAIQKVVRLVDQANESVGDDRGLGRAKPVGVGVAPG